MELNQWFFRITRYADELLDFSGLEWPERVMTMQKNWIGRSEGAEIWFMAETGERIPVFTTGPDTLFGTTFIVLAPEHPLVLKFTSPSQRHAVMNYAEDTRRQSEIQRLATNGKSGVATGAFAIHPANGERIPIFVANYVLMQYGTGAVVRTFTRRTSLCRKFGTKRNHLTPFRRTPSEPAAVPGVYAPAHRIQ